MLQHASLYGYNDCEDAQNIAKILYTLTEMALTWTNHHIFCSYLSRRTAPFSIWFRQILRFSRGSSNIFRLGVWIFFYRLLQVCTELLLKYPLENEQFGPRVGLRQTSGSVSAFWPKSDRPCSNASFCTNWFGSVCGTFLKRC